MSEDVLVIIDSNSTNIVYGGESPGSWTTESSPTLFNKTSASSGTAPGSINITFTGNAIALYGRSHPLGGSQEMTVTIDEQKSYNTTFPADQAGSYCQWWQSPMLNDGTHTIQLEGLTQTSLDFAAITVPKSSLHTGQNIIVDDADASMVYSGNWIRNGSLIPPGGEPDSLPFHNLTHQCNTVGSSVSFNFTGSSIVVYGMMPGNPGGSITAKYTLDSFTTNQMYQKPGEPIQGFKELQNTILYSNASLSAGFHTLSIEIQDMQNLAYSIDYVVYTYFNEVQSSSIGPSTTAAPKSFSPSVVPMSSDSSSKATTTTSLSASSSSSPSIATGTTTITSSAPFPPVFPSIPTSESQSVTSTVPTPTAVAARSSDMTARMAKTIGLTVGSVAILAILIAAILYWRRRRRHVLPLQTIDHSTVVASRSRSPIAVQPFTLSEPTPGSRAASGSKGSLYSSDRSNAVPEHLVHRRSWSAAGSNVRASLEDGETQDTLATSSSSILNGIAKPLYGA